MTKKELVEFLIEYYNKGGIKMTKKELVKFLIDNFTDKRGNLNLKGLDFTEFKGIIDISGMKISSYLLQNNHKVEGDVYQSNHEVKGDLYQYRHKVNGDLFQNGHEVKGSIYQSMHELGGNIVEGEHKRLLKEITLEELKEMGYKLK